MTQILIALSVWLHAVGTVILIGHYLLLSLIYLPVLAKKDGMILSEISKRSRLWLYISLLIFLVTGTYLTLVDPNYLGIGKFGNLWAILMLVKHILIVGMIALGFWFNAILRVGPMMSSNNSAEQAINRFGSYSKLMAISGILVLLLTALAQVE
ncbi:MAG TPA: hypothetical protein VK249_31040 [Anaerolineales bacterium]|nr:hypothetical protein [Anaerolineales bacterium]